MIIPSVEEYYYNSAGNNDNSSSSSTPFSEESVLQSIGNFSDILVTFWEAYGAAAVAAGATATAWERKSGPAKSIMDKRPKATDGLHPR